MATIKASVTVKGVDLKEMMSVAQSQLEELAGTKWTITQVDLWGSEDVANAQGLAQMWSASISAEATL